MLTKDQTSDRDPIKDSPLRDPGQSLRARVLDQFLDRMLFWLVAAVIAFTIAILEWFRWLSNVDSVPVPITMLAFTLGLIAAWRWRRTVRELQQMKLGLKGERAVGQYLQATFLPLGYFVIHDVCGVDYNIDHALIGPDGVFAIEVKTCSKPRRGGGKISYDGQRVLVDGFVPDRDPIKQAHASAKSLQRILEQHTGRKVPVRPVVLFPGRWIERQPSGAEVWVLNPKGLPSFVANEKPKLTAQDSRLLAEGLARYVREQVDA